MTGPRHNPIVISTLSAPLDPSHRSGAMKVAPLAISLISATLATTATVLFLSERNSLLETEGRLARAQAETTTQIEYTRRAKDDSSRLEASLAEAAKTQAGLRSELSTAHTLQADTTQNLALTQNLLKLRDENERTLNREIATLNQDLTSANTRLQEMESLRARINALEQDLALAKNPSAPDGRPTEASTNTPRAILALGPSDSFLVVNFGSKQNAATGQRLIIRRGTDLIGTALISNCLADVSIAQVDPHSLRESLRIGDAIILAP